MELPAGGESLPPGERRLCLVLHTWGHPSTFYAWCFMKQYVLRRVEQNGTTLLDPREKLFIVKAGKVGGEESAPDRWKVGGPLVPDLDTALAHYPHSVVRLEGSVRSNIRTFVEQNDIDMLITPDYWPGFSLPGFNTSLSEWVKQNVACPFLVIRRGAVVNARMKISSQLPAAAVAPAAPAAAPAGGGGEADAVLERTSTTLLMPTAAQAGRRIAVAYNSFAVGRGLMAFARDKVLTRNDTVYICHVFSHHNPVVKDALKLMRVMTLQRAESVSDEVTRDNSITFGAEELAGYAVQLNVTLQGDPKASVSSFCESEDIELLIIGSRSGGKIRKKLSGGGVSSYLIDNAPCPCVVVPYKFMGVEDGATADEELGTSPTSPPALWGALSPPSASAAAAGAAAAAAGPSAAAAGAPGGTANAAVQTEGPAVPPQAAAVADTVAAAGGAAHSTPSDLLAQLRNQLEEKDRTIAELRQQVHALQLAAAEREASSRHDPTQAGLAM